MSAIVSRTLRTWGESESGLNERLHGVIQRLDGVGNPTLAFLASGWEGIKVRLTAKAGTRDEAERLLNEWDRAVRDEIGNIVFGVDGETMESVIVNMLKDRGLTLGLAESVTGGLVSGRITNVPGSSAVLRGGVVSYASEVKFSVLGVPNGPVVSEEAAIAMARGAKRVLGSDIGLALTGVAGPESQEGQQPGTLCIGLAMDDDRTHSTMLNLSGTRDLMRQLSVISSLDFLRKRLLQK